MGGHRKNPELRFKGAAHVLSALPDSRLMAALTRGKGGWRHLEETLFDTADQSLAAAGVSLFLRRKAGAETQIIKRYVTCGKGTSGRWRTAIKGEDYFPADSGNTAIDKLLEIHKPNLCKVMHLEIDRWKATFPFKKSTLEIRLDLATVIAKRETKKNSFPVVEASLRLKKGKAKDLFSVARLLLAEGTLRLDAQSSHQAAMAAVSGRQYATPRKSRTRIASVSTAGDHLGISLATLAERIILIQPLIIDARLEEGVHQMRVELRRLRAIERVYRKTAAGPELGGLAVRARKIARILGPARDWDVFTRKTLRSARKGGYAADGFAILTKKAQKARARAWASAVAEISSGEFTAFALEILEYSLTKPWENKNDRQLEMPVKKFAVKAQERELRKAHKVAALVTADNPASLHALRIAVKKLRYCNQLFRNVYSKKRRSEYMSAMASLQKSFGDINDAVTAQRLVNVVSKHGGPHAMRAAGFLSGYYAAQLDAASKAITTSWNSFEAMRPFWRKAEKDD